MRMLPLPIASGPRALHRVALGHRHQCAKYRAAWARVALDDAAMVADDLGDEGQAETGTGRLGGDEGVEEMLHEIGRHARAVVLDRNLKRQADPRLAAWNREPDPRPERGHESDLPVCPLLADRLGRVLDEIEEHLDQLVPAPRHRRQRGIVILDDLDLAGEAGACDLLYVVEHVMDVDRLALKRALVPEDLHAVDQLADAI